MYLWMTLNYRAEGNSELLTPLPRLGLQADTTISLAHTISSYVVLKIKYGASFILDNQPTNWAISQAQKLLFKDKYRKKMSLVWWCTPLSTGETEAGKSCEFWASLVYRSFQDSQSYVKERPCLQKRKMGSLPWEYNSVVELAHHMRLPRFDSKHYIKRKEWEQEWGKT